MGGEFEHEHEHEHEGRDTLAGAVGDEALLRHIFTNLLSNACKYSEPGQEVGFACRREGDSAVFVVSDDGIGIPEEDQAQLFTSFTRARNVGSRPGTGLGLVVVQRCVKLHGGELSMESKVDVGTTATVTLPLFGVPPSGGPETAQPPKGGTPNEAA